MPNATAYLTSNFGVIGTITFTQQAPNAAVAVSVNITGLTPGFHALHVNTYGDISQRSSTTGSTFNPTNGISPGGNLGNIQADAAGVAQTQMFSQQISVIEGQPGQSIVGRAIVVYANANPNFGAAVAWGVIGHMP